VAYDQLLEKTFTDFFSGHCCDCWVWEAGYFQTSVGEILMQKFPEFSSWYSPVFLNILYVASVLDIIVRATMLCDVTHQCLVICWSKDKFLLVLSFHVCYYCCCHIPLSEIELWWSLSVISQDKSKSWIIIRCNRKYCFPKASYSINFCPHKSRISY
jgi:hypothetical protein